MLAHNSGKYKLPLSTSNSSNQYTSSCRSDQQHLHLEGRMARPGKTSLAEADSVTVLQQPELGERGSASRGWWRGAGLRRQTTWLSMIREPLWDQDAFSRFSGAFMTLWIVPGDHSSAPPTPSPAGSTLTSRGDREGPDRWPPRGLLHSCRS